MSNLIVHRGGRIVNRNELEAVVAPAATSTWFPVRHAAVVDTVQGALRAAGFGIVKEQFALGGENHRMFATMDLATGLADGVTLSVGIRNSTDKSLPLGFCAGSRVFVCDNLAFRSDLIVRRKHTRFGQDRFNEAICLAVSQLVHFQANERQRINVMQAQSISDRTAESYLLRSFEAGLVSHLTLPKVIHEWRQPTYPEFQPRTLWSLFNAYTTVLGPAGARNPQRYAALTMRLGELLDPAQAALDQAA
jgi:hypothetical protein